jgi:NAD(P)-dependent dehydrogenase (short-subunit alcohol dehydrogenase family)
MKLAGRVALVTGAGSGIGKATALLLARQGMSVGALSDTEAEVRATADEIRRAGGESVSLVADVGDTAAMRDAVKRLVHEYGRLDIVVANAGINGIRAPIELIAPEEWDETIRTNLRGTYLTLHLAIPHLKKAGGGSVVIVSSVDGTRLFSDAGSSPYSCTKAAQVALAKVAALELAKHRIRVNAVCPGSIATEIGDNTYERHVERAEVKVEYPDGEIPLTDGEPGSAEDVAELILFLVSERARHITGTPVFIDGAQSLLVG